MIKRLNCYCRWAPILMPYQAMNLARTQVATKLLLERGIRLDVKDDFGCTPLFPNSIRKIPPAKVLPEAGATIDARILQG